MFLIARELMNEWLTEPKNVIDLHSSEANKWTVFSGLPTAFTDFGLLNGFVLVFFQLSFSFGMCVKTKLTTCQFLITPQ